MPWANSPFQFPKLPILSQAEIPPAPRLSQREKYGGLFYVGIAGLVLLCLMVGWFAYGFWSLRDVWEDVYVLHNPRRTRVRSRASRLSSQPRSSRQRRPANGDLPATRRARSGPLPASGSDFHRRGRERPAKFLAGGGPQLRLARLAPAPAGAATDVWGRSRICDPSRGAR